MATIQYCRPTENVAGVAVPVASSADATYPASYLTDGNPGRPAKLAATSGQFSWDFGAAQRVDVVALIHHNLTAGLEVRIQGDDASDFGSLAVNETVTIPAWRDDGFTVSPWLDLTGVSGYSETGLRYWRINVVGVNAANVAIGEIVLGAHLRTLERNVSWGATEGEEHPIVEHRTDFGVSTIYDFGTFWRRLSGELDTTDQGWISWQAVAQAARGRARPFLLIPDPDVNDAWLVRLADTKFGRGQTFLERQQVSVAFEEVARGLPL